MVDSFPILRYCGISFIVLTAGLLPGCSKKETEPPKVKPPSVPLETDWITYTDSIYPFSIDYPSDWVVSDFNEENNAYRVVGFAKEFPAQMLAAPEDERDGDLTPEDIWPVTMLSVTFYKESQAYFPQNTEKIESNKNSEYEKTDMNGIPAVIWKSAMVSIFPQLAGVHCQIRLSGIPVISDIIKTTPEFKQSLEDEIWKTAQSFRWGT